MLTTLFDFEYRQIVLYTTYLLCLNISEDLLI